MSSKSDPAIRSNFINESDEKLLGIWKHNDRTTYSPATFATIEEILRERKIALPSQDAPVREASTRSSGSLMPIGISALILGIIGSSVSQSIVSQLKLSEESGAALLLTGFFSLLLIAGIILIIASFFKKKKPT